ncbi:NifB/NifX family molybdenum-iron cluster-binding protein [Allochromatium vinosum]|uniref:Dinitrogenase iron-molybdenum cofactor biosynthesis protein n=1 Tax=Allochromatium vinosum (strain ATCC 17899 / DSM 180 / NBRC 103801 / NCIMB 10441 / D) TaxID=572477 RepID=D3RU11_ALLVD|nr:NifB/NifX family molybdenum-iron cluster-binding protein [Allochromatium vinosum]ADC62670.1 Dinitrogenase iron-molybdenum cofactor biosynthesis protein [Allochromatium vinosum DSM 180]MBK1653330.1 dinitrogenase iron-molybdenum cofactor biosynthesis protein [Allochromatium vinosum]
MKLAISMAGDTLEAAFDARFGRAPFFVLVDSESGEWTCLPNPALEADGGAGVRAAQFLASQGAQAVVSGAYGPKAWTTLHAAGLRTLLAPEGQDALIGRQLLDQFRAGALRAAEAASHDGHHGG